MSAPMTPGQEPAEDVLCQVHVLTHNRPTKDVLPIIHQLTEPWHKHQPAALAAAKEREWVDAALLAREDTIRLAQRAQRDAESIAANLQRLFDLQQTRMGKATALWREATGKRDVMPDLGDLLDWLMSSAARERKGDLTYEARLAQAAINLLAAETRIGVLEGCVRLAHDVLRRVPRLALGPTRELQDSIMVDVLVAMRQCAALLAPVPSAEPSGERGAKSPKAGEEGV